MNTSLKQNIQGSFKKSEETKTTNAIDIQKQMDSWAKTQKKSKSKPMNKLVEFKGFNGDFRLGDKITVDHFVEGEFVDISGITKGKGFQGVVKRHGFAGVGDSTHGQHNRMRAPGSIGAGSDPSRVFKGMRMAGQTGNSKVKVLNLKVVKVMSEDNILIVKGSVPGHNNSYITVRK
jgi:large subunit ribosomal protein L3